MALFAVLASLLTLATMAALAYALRAGAPRVAVAVALLVPILVGGLYAIVGTPQALDPEQRRAPDSLEDAIARLEADLQRDPRQPEGWQLLGRAYAGLERFDASRDAFARAALLLPDDDALQVEAAQARARAAPDRRFDATAVQALREVLARNPDHQHARWYLGIAQRQAGDDAGAVATWTPLLALLDGAAADALREQIAVAREAAGLPAPAAPAAPATASTHEVRVRVRLDPAAAPPPADAVVFVIARQAGGPPMPVAVQRHPVSALPLDIVLGDADSPMPTQPLSALRAVEILARISRSGDAARADGDAESAAVRVALPVDAPVELVISRQAP
ncbi:MULTISPECIES: cytochrome C biogenesis protein [Luteimonas]|uniref:Cytochrome C biogenesis protein n=1 Tax=Luteimonas chenhongjianii TaxID=2006110 RepID=A0A290XFV5_9GAMM|nr:MULTISPECIES: cytochrome C biogenesis protein [Luteimonas]ATD68007.1 cytochrome C biogenesis protein [Luteimonas chenhongjianii]RPD88329.1 cytochrome C biogenesis protein [Luteimonas sp. 100069]